MMIPKCLNGTMIPMVMADGALYPCCSSSVLWKQKIIDGPGPTGNRPQLENPFEPAEFNLHNHSFADIVESEKWYRHLNALRAGDIRTCVNTCGTDQPPRYSAVEDFDLDGDVPTKLVRTADLRDVQLEFTSRCTLKCPYCPRLWAKENTDQSTAMNRHDLPLEIVRDVFRYKNWASIVDCGTFGDAIWYKHYHEMLELLDECAVECYRVAIAATGRSEAWWNETLERWKYLHEAGTYVVVFWGIDGLEDTSKIHRIGQDWDEITGVMRRAAEAGINNFWQFIPFNHNEHQITEARELAEKWGVKFWVRPSDRWKLRPDLDMKPRNQGLRFDIARNSERAQNNPKVGE